MALKTGMKDVRSSCLWLPASIFQDLVSRFLAIRQLKVREVVVKVMTDAF